MQTLNSTFRISKHTHRLLELQEVLACYTDASAREMGPLAVANNLVKVTEKCSHPLDMHAEITLSMRVLEPSDKTPEEYKAEIGQLQAQLRKERQASAEVDTGPLTEALEKNRVLSQKIQRMKTGRLKEIAAAKEEGFKNGVSRAKAAFEAIAPRPMFRAIRDLTDF